MRHTNDFVEDRWNIIAQSPFKSADYKTEKEKRRMNIDVCLVENPNIIVPIGNVPVNTPQQQNRQTLRSVLTEIVNESKITNSERIQNRAINNNIEVKTNHELRERHESREHLKILDPITGQSYEIGFCPLCGVATVHDGGCNYMKCDDADRSMIPEELRPPKEELCQQQWCFECYKPKYRPIPGKEYLGFCNDPDHHSH